jgi:hypothetical protein
MRIRVVAVVVGVVAAAAMPAVQAGPIPHSRPAPHGGTAAGGGTAARTGPVPRAGTAALARPAGEMSVPPARWVVRPGAPVRPAPRTERTAWRTSPAAVSSVTMYCFGHYARRGQRDVWIYGGIVDGATGRRGDGWLWAGDLLATGPYGLPYC